MELLDALSAVQAENGRLLAENASLKRSTLAMQGKGDEIRHTAETHKDEAAAAAAAVEGESGESKPKTAVGDGETEALKKELARVRMERSILKREVLRLMKVNEELTRTPSAVVQS